MPAEDALTKEALAAAIEATVRGVKTWVLPPEHLMAIALKLGRKKDEARVERFIELGKYDQNKLDDILIRYDLVARWRKMSDQYMGSTQ